MGSALGVCDVAELFVLGLIEHVVNLSWYVVLTELIETEVEKLLVVLNWVKVSIVPTVKTASVVAKPHVKPFSRKCK